MNKILLAILALALSGCGTSVGTYAVNLSFQPFSSAVMLFGDPRGDFVARASTVTALKFCFKRLRFKVDQQATANTETDSNNIDFALGEVALASGGTTLGEVLLAPGSYRTVEFDLEDHCASGKSIQVTNSHGSFSTDDRVTLKFRGTFEHTETSKSLAIALSTILTALEGVTSNSQIKNDVEGADGSF